MRRSQLNSLDVDWRERDLFRKESRVGLYLWMVILFAFSFLAFQHWHQIPGLLLDSFKAIAHLAPPSHSGLN